ncbi:hypothetical protein AB0K60_34790 [Thermopolyspora sp. NPDC052614]|uniref:hypothetical protein n=1 Tax=Thermopolyspora sp. NPDC052614 TaxID=3155682 RepID=UPI003412AEEF
MKSTGLVRRLAAAGAGVAVLATMAIGLTAGSASASTAAAGTAATTAATGVYATTPVASPKHFKGECPVDVTFTSKIKVKVKGKTTVAYRWLHGDGSKSKVKTLTLRGKGTKYVTVKEKSTFKEDVKGWQALQVLEPRKTTTKKGYFSVSCAPSFRDEVERPSFVTASVDVPDFSGVCTPYSKVTAEGLIRVGKPTWVKYRWIHNGEVVDDGAIKVYGAKKVYYTFHPRHSHKGSVKLDIVRPRHGDDDTDFYTVWCKRPVERDEPVKAWASASGAGGYVGACPVERTFTGTVSANGRAVVKYRWAGPNYNGPVQTVFFGKHGPKARSVSDAVTFTESGVAKRWIEILDPNHAVSNVAVASVKCTKPAPPQAKVTDVDVSASADNTTCANGKAPGVSVSGTIAVSGPTKVTYSWVVNGRSVEGGTIDVQRFASVSLKVDPAAQGDTTTGAVSLIVTSPNPQRGGAHFSFTCPNKAATA